MLKLVARKLKLFTTLLIMLEFFYTIILIDQQSF